MLSNCLFGTYRAPATKKSFLSISSANPATIRIDKLKSQTSEYGMGSRKGSLRAVRRPSKSVTVVKGMADVVHRDVHRHQEHTDAGSEEDLESPREADAD